MNASPRATPAAKPEGSPPGEVANSFEGGLLSIAQRTEIDRVLKQVGGNKTAAARLLGVSRRSLYRWIDRLDLVDPTGPPQKD
ncbi:MAG: helix-turn-helix domain-containing protein [Vicinamibacterales bacterium]